MATSSAEAELYALASGTSEALCVREFLNFFKVCCQVRARTDSSVAKAVALRQGAGRFRHLAVCQLWLHQDVSSGRLEMINRHVDTTC